MGRYSERFRLGGRSCTPSEGANYADMHEYLRRDNDPVYRGQKAREALAGANPRLSPTEQMLADAKAAQAKGYARTQARDDEARGLLGMSPQGAAGAAPGVQ